NKSGSFATKSGRRLSTGAKKCACKRRRCRSGMAKKLAAECFGTFALVFAGTGAIVIDEVTGGSVSHVGIALTFGLIVLAMVYTLGDISGAHINPAVTIGFWAARRFDADKVLPYIV